jgi:hypothetical protein
MCDGWERAKQNSFDPTEHCGICLDDECKAKQRKDRKSSAPRNAKPEAKILERRLHFRFV